METELARATQANELLRHKLDQRWYPTFHITAPAGWINDPNGVCFYRGRHHVFFQHHPDAAKWGPMHWGHVSSTDLVHWRPEPIALAPSLLEDRDGVWSGSCVEAPDGRLLAFYTGHRWRNGVDESEGMVQVQCLAESDDGVRFRKRGVVVRGPEELHHFRDPKVFRHDDTWYMIFGASSADARGQVWMYTSSDLEHWDFDRIVYEDPRPDVFMLECPDLFPLDGHWVLTCCPMSSARPTGYGMRNGHNAGYIVGQWQPGSDFQPEGKFQHGDWGHHFYAPQSMQVPDGRRVTFGWMGGFTLPLASQAADGWSGQLAVPRELGLNERLQLVARPIRELEQLRTGTIDLGSFVLDADRDRLLLDDCDTADVELEVDLTASTAEQVCLLVHQTSPSQFTKVAYDDLSGRVVLDRGVGNATDRGYRAAPFPGGDTLRLRVLVDRGSVEVFVGDGSQAVTSLSFPPDGRRRLTLASVSGTVTVTSLVVHRLGSGWDLSAATV